MNFDINDPFQAGRAFERKMTADAAFRQHVETLGWTDDSIVIFADHESMVGDIVDSLRDGTNVFILYITSVGDFYAVKASIVGQGDAGTFAVPTPTPVSL